MGEICQPVDSRREIRLMAPTSAADPERARKQREQYPPPDERDWHGLLYGLALAVGGVLTVIGVIHLYVRYF